jgi:two-component system, NtrC family, sensor kinase
MPAEANHPPPADAANPYLRLRRQMVRVLLGFGLLPLVAMGAAGFLANRESVQTRTRNVLEAMIKNRRVTVEFFLEDTLRQLALVADALPVSELSKPDVLAGLRDAARREHSAIVDLGLISDGGAHVAYVGPYKLQSVNYSGEAWFQQVMLRGRYESDVFLGFRRFPHMVMAVKKRDSGRDWILRATIDTDVLSALVREGGLESGADVFVLNRVGEYQTRYSDEHRLMERAELGPIPPHSGVRVVERESGTRRQYVATAWLRGDSWVLVARQEVPGGAGLLVAHPIVIVVFALGLVVIPALSVLIARHRLRQIRSLEEERGALYESVAQSQKMAAIGRLAAGVAHEINNPLSIILAQVGLLADVVGDGKVPELAELRERVKKIQAQVERARKVTQRLLGFSRRVGPELEPVNVVAALDETLSFLEKELEAQEIKVVRDYSDDVPMIRSNLSQMQQVFLNLINNAVDAMGRGGEVRLSARPQAGGVEVRVADRGPGIAEKDLARIFEPFFSTKTEGKTHSGLGLSICQEIMRHLGGRIGVSSRLGEGTVFTLWFPPEPEA